MEHEFVLTSGRGLKFKNTDNRLKCEPEKLDRKQIPNYLQRRL